MEKEFQDLIKKNLPQHVGEALRERLAQADKDLEELERAKNLIIVLQKDIKGFQSELQEYHKLDERNSALDLREKELDRRENKANLDELTYQLSSEKEKTQFAKELSMGLVRNTEYRKNIFDSFTDGQPMVDGLGLVHYPMSTSKSYTSTETKE